MTRRSRQVVLLLVVAVLTVAAHHHLPHDVRIQRGDAYVPRPEFAKRMSLGFDSVLADYYWVQAVLLAGESNDPESESVQLGRLIDVVTTLDPWVDHPYRFAAVWLAETLEDVRHGNMLLRRSFPYHPDEWRNRFYLGFNLFYYLDDSAAAAEVLDEASKMTGAPAYLPRLVARLRSESADLAAAGLFLEELVRSSEDGSARASYQAALDEVEVEWRARALDRARESYRELHGRDIESVQQLVTGPQAVLSALPEAEPSSLPAPLRRGSTWQLDPATGQIVSSYFSHRYAVHIDSPTRQKLEAMRRDDASRSAVGKPGKERGASNGT